MNPVWILVYFYPDGTFAGVIGAYSNLEKASAAFDAHKLIHADCSFLITGAPIQ